MIVQIKENTLTLTSLKNMYFIKILKIKDQRTRERNAGNNNPIKIGRNPQIAHPRYFLMQKNKLENTNTKKLDNTTFFIKKKASKPQTIQKIVL